MKPLIRIMLFVVLGTAGLFADTQTGLPDKIVGTWIGEGTDGNTFTLMFDSGSNISIKAYENGSSTPSLNERLTIDMQFANDDLQTYEANLVSGDVVFMKATFMFDGDDLNVKFDDAEDYTLFSKQN